MQANLLKNILQKTAGCPIIPHRTRYYWENRPENRTRKMVMQVTLPRISGRKYFDELETQPPEESGPIKKLYGLDVVFHKEIVSLFETSRFIAVLLKADMEEEQYYATRHEMRIDNIFMEEYPNHVMEYTLRGTKYENLLKLYTNQTVTLFSNELNIKNLTKVIKNNPQLLLMGGMIEGEYLSPNQLSEFATLPDIDHLRGELSATLSSVAASTSQLLQHQQSMLVTSLDQYIKDTSEKK